MFALMTDHFPTSRTCLDAACNSGYHAFALASRGLSVVGIDTDQAAIEQARFVQSSVDDPAGNMVRFRCQDLMRLPPTERYDLVFCSGLFYHVRDPVGGARQIANAASEGAIVQSFVSDLGGDVLELANSAKYVCCFAGEFSLVPTASMLKKIFRYAGFRDVRRFTASELCSPDELASLRPHYAGLFRHGAAYYVLKR
jgi:2-polyprenyl-3-methyl-5-hydroxy-6-metoxy-1,4-benzoquinol methylase